MNEEASRFSWICVSLNFIVNLTFICYCFLHVIEFSHFLKDLKSLVLSFSLAFSYETCLYTQYPMFILYKFVLPFKKIVSLYGNDGFI